MKTLFKVKTGPFFSIKFNRIGLFKLLWIFFISGLIYGVLIVGLKFEDVSGQCEVFVQKFIENRLSESLFVLFCSSFFNFGLFIFAQFIISFIPVSQIIFLIFPVFYGLGLGLISTYLIISQHLDGLLILSLTIVPRSIISTIVLLLGCREGFRFSNKNFIKLIFPKKNLNYRVELKLYFLKFLTLIFFQFISAALDILFNLIFVKYV